MVTSDTLFYKAIIELSKIVLQNKKDIEALKKGGSGGSTSETVTTRTKSESNDFLNEALGTSGVEYFTEEGTDSDTKQSYSKASANTYLNDALGTKDVEYVSDEGSDTIEEKDYTIDEANTWLNDALRTSGETYVS